MSTIDRRGATVSAADPPIGTNPNPDLAIKAPVRAATTGSNIALSGTQTIDGVSLNVGDRVLVKDQTTGSQNGLYLVASGTWPRAVDAASSALVVPETAVRVSEGSVNAHSEWYLSTQGPIAVGTTALS